MKKEGKLWLQDRKTRRRFNVFMILALTLSTIMSTASWTLYIFRVKDDTEGVRHYVLLGTTCLTFLINFVLQCLTLVILIKAYLIIKDASKTLGLNTKD